jgi:hypothetical protein
MDIMSFSPGNFFEKVEHSNIGNGHNEYHYSVPKEIIDSLTEQLKVKDELLKEQQKIIAKLLG